MFGAAARLQELLGGDIDREYCMKLYDTYPKTSEPELLASYTKVCRGVLISRCATAAGAGEIDHVVIVDGTLHA